MKQFGGFWYPDGDETFHLFHPEEAARDIPFFLQQVQGRGTVVQAGANVGTYPLALADHFQRVITFEPDPENWACLQANLAARDGLKRIKAHNAGLADRWGSATMDRPEPQNCGANRTVPGEGAIKLMPIDAFYGFRAGERIDAIWLDIEGMELAALKGAESLIRKHSPVIITEENGNGERYGVGPNDIEIYLATLGYERDCGIGNDRYYRRPHG